MPLADDVLLIMLNAHHEAVDFTLPTAAGRRAPGSSRSTPRCPTSNRIMIAAHAQGDTVAVTARSLSWSGPWTRRRDRAGTPLDRLAEAHRIEPAYTDIWGRRHAIGEDSKRALLGAMGVAADSDAAPSGASLEAVQAAACVSASRSGRSAWSPKASRSLIPVTTDASHLRQGRLEVRRRDRRGDGRRLQALAGSRHRGAGREGRARRLLPLPSPSAARLSPPDVHCARRARETAETTIIVTSKRAWWPARPRSRRRRRRADRPPLRPALRTQCRHR